MCSIEINPFLDRLESFTDMAHSPSVIAKCQDIVDSLNRDAQAYRSILSQHNDNGFGLIFANDTGDQWTIIFEDMSEPGRYRHQVFTNRGFLSHHTFDTIEEVIEDVVDLGYRTPDPTALDRLCNTDDWIEGSRMGALIQQLNAGLIDWTQFTSHAET